MAQTTKSSTSDATDEVSQSRPDQDLLDECGFAFEQWDFTEKPEKMPVDRMQKYREKMEALEKKRKENNEFHDQLMKTTTNWEPFADATELLLKLVRSAMPPPKESVEKEKIKKCPPRITARNRHLSDNDDAFMQNAWDDVEWSEEMQTQAYEAVAQNSSVKVDNEKKSLVKSDASSYWDRFYGIHQNKFFRDRNWLFSEFPELKSPYGASVSLEKEEYDRIINEKRHNESYIGEKSKFKVLEIGCGAGNTVFPLLQNNNNPETFVYCCDFSSTAVQIVTNSAYFDPQRCKCFQLDITSEKTESPFENGTIDVIVLIFVISALPQEKFDRAIKNIYTFLKPGGLVLFRDYGRYDLAQLRFKKGACVEENCYVRGDGTLVYFFRKDEVEQLFSKQGFTTRELMVDKRLQINRGKQLKMFRVWIQGKFLKPELKE